MKVKPDLSFWKLWNISFGFFGVQIAYALQSANISRIFATLGADPHSLSYFWILPPLAGIIVQPIVGAASDKTWTRFGRRIPYLFVGSPKIGKSFFMAQLAYHVSTGTPLWDYPVKKGTVLYLALEDDYRRLQERMYRMFGTDSTENLYFSVSSKPLGNGLTDQLSGFIREHPDTTLVIIDTLQKIREVDSDSYSYAKDYEIINQLKQFSDSWGICLLLVHHTRKQKSSDNFDMISGTNGLLGCADGAFMLYKENRTSNKATLEISGRDQQDQKIHLIRDEEKLCWNFEKAETELWKEPPEPLLECIANLVTEENPTWQGTATELIEKLGLDMKPNVVSLKLNVNAGRLMNDYSIRYTNKRNHSGRMIFFSLLSKE